MKYHKGWSYTPYKPLLFNTGDIYICRVAPYETSIVFDWLDIGEKEYDYYRIKEQAEFIFLTKSLSDYHYTIGQHCTSGCTINYFSVSAKSPNVIIKG